MGVEILGYGFVGNGYKLGFQDCCKYCKQHVIVFEPGKQFGRFLNPLCGFGDIVLVFADDFMILFNVILNLPHSKPVSKLNPRGRY